VQAFAAIPSQLYNLLTINTQQTTNAIDRMERTKSRLTLTAGTQCIKESY